MPNSTIPFSSMNTALKVFTQHLVKLVGLNVDVSRPRKTPMPVGVNCVEKDKTPLQPKSAPSLSSRFALVLVTGRCGEPALHQSFKPMHVSTYTGIIQVFEAFI